MKTAKILVVSDATGETAERVIRSALVQFEGARPDVQRWGNVRSKDHVREVVAHAAAEKAFVLHTLVSDELRHTMLRETRGHGVDAMDLMGPVLDRLATHLRLSPQEKPGLFGQLTAARSREIEAVEFAFRHDDGQHLDEIERAEICLVGVSRTMKTPTTLYLAYRGWFAANCPIVEGFGLPEVVLSLPRRKVFCLNMNASRLWELRRARAEYLGITWQGYATLSSVRRELQFARRITLDRGWHEINVTGKSVEEVASEILILTRGQSGPRPPVTGGEGAEEEP